MNRFYMSGLLGGVALVALIGSPALAQDDGAAVGEQTRDEIIVNGSRLPTTLTTMPGSVSVVDYEALQDQLAVTSDIGAVLGQLVPGMGTSSSSPSNIQTSLRGRKPVVFVDGIPITPTLNDVGRELRMIDPSVIERIEVVRGSSALFGNSAGAGFINYITRAGDKGPLRMSTEIGSQLSLTSIGDGLRPSVRQTFAGGGGNVDYRLVGSYEQTGSFYDADGDRIAPIPNGFSGLADSEIYSTFGRLGLDAGDGRFEINLNHYHQEQDTDFTLQNGDVSAGIKVTAVPKGPGDTEEANQFHENSLASLSYSNPEIMGTGLRTSVYYQKSKSIFGMEFGRFVRTPKPDGQSNTSSTKYGARIDLNTPLDFLANDSELLWGFDYLNDTTRADLVDGRVFAPPQELDSKALFAQLRVNVLPQMTVTAGIRHEWSTLSLEDFTSLLSYAASSIGSPGGPELSRVTGGDLKYDATPLNLGVTYDVSESINLFAGFSQGFEITGVGRELRGTPEHVSVTVLQPDPNVIDSYEAGVRGNWDGVQASFSVFKTESSNGLSFTIDPLNPNVAITKRSADEVYGFEATADVEVSDRSRVGGSFSWLEGRQLDDQGVFVKPLQNRRIPPRIITAYGEYDFSNNWTVRLQALHSGARDKFPGSTAFWEGEINPWLNVDISAHGDIGPGTLIVGVNNLLNSDHYTHVSESAQQDSRYSKAPGATANIRYKIEY